MDKNRFPLLLWYDCEATNGHLDADIVEIAIRSWLFRTKSFALSFLRMKSCPYSVSSLSFVIFFGK